MAHKHPVYDTDKHFVIDPITKKISTESPKLVLAQHSHKSERFTFEIPKEVEGHDMSLCNLVEIHYLNIDAANKSNKSADIYKVEDLQIGTDDTADIVFGSWLIDGNATQYVGNLNFAVSFACIADDGTIDYCWPTLLYSNITVGETIWNTETIVSEHSDIIAQFEARIAALEQTGGGTVKSVNGIEPDENGNVEITIPDSGGNVDQSGGLSGTAKTLLINILRNAIYSTDQSANITLLESALSSGNGSGGGGESVVQYSITNNLTNVTNSNAAVTVAENGMYIATLIASEGYELDSVTVTMGGVDVTASVYSGGTVTIPSVTGNIVITASAVESAPESSYIQSGLLHEFTDLTTSRTIAGGQSIFNSEDDFTVFAAFAGKSVSVIGKYGSTDAANKTQFVFGTTWDGKFGAQVWLTDNSAYPVILCTPSDTSGDVMYHACVVKSGNIYTLYIDGETLTGNTMNSNGKHYIQNGDLVINANDKPIDKVLIYNRALSTDEITANFATMKLEVGE